jgi:hypothetical protein
LDKKWSDSIRKRDGKCVLCGAKDKPLFAHHFIVARANSVKYRYDVRNGVALCYPCHLLKVHNLATFEYVGELVEKAKELGILTYDDLVEILRDRKTNPDMNLGQDLAFLEAVKISLTKEEEEK